MDDRGRRTSSGVSGTDFGSLAEVLRDQGYATYMSGKWHVTLDAAFETPNGSYPVQRGFDKYYGCLHGGEAITNQIPFIIICNGLPSFGWLLLYHRYHRAAVSFIKQHPTPDSHVHVHTTVRTSLSKTSPPKTKIDACRERYKAGWCSTPTTFRTSKSLRADNAGNGSSSLPKRISGR